MNYLNRFENNPLGEEYSLFALSVPHYTEFQNTITRTLAEFCSSINRQQINVLEIGTGNGITTARILDSDPRITVTTIDNSRVMLDQAMQAFEDTPEKVKFVENDALSALNKIQDASFDCFASAYTLHNLPESYRNKVFTEINRVLKPDSLFINADKIATDDPKLHLQTLRDQIERFQVYSTPEINRPDILEAWTKHYLEDGLTILTEKYHLEILAKLGFEASTIFRKEMEAVITGYKSN